jgi:hypothetical protein
MIGVAWIGGCLISLYLLIHTSRERQRERLRAEAARWPLTQPGPQPPFSGTREIQPEVTAMRTLYRRIATRVRHGEMKAPSQCRS